MYDVLFNLNLSLDECLEVWPHVVLGCLSSRLGYRAWVWVASVAAGLPVGLPGCKLCCRAASLVVMSGCYSGVGLLVGRLGCLPGCWATNFAAKLPRSVGLGAGFWFGQGPGGSDAGQCDQAVGCQLRQQLGS